VEVYAVLSGKIEKKVVTYLRR